MGIEKYDLRRDYKNDFTMIDIDKTDYKMVINSIPEVPGIEKSSNEPLISHVIQSKPGNKDMPFFMTLEDYNQIDMKRNKKTREYYTKIEKLFVQNKTIIVNTECKVRSYLAGKELVEITDE